MRYAPTLRNHGSTQTTTLLYSYEQTIFLCMIPYTPQAWDRTNNNLFFKLGTIRLEDYIFWYNAHTQAWTAQYTMVLCSHGQTTFSWV